jgi:hypothetical protein
MNLWEKHFSCVAVRAVSLVSRRGTPAAAQDELIRFLGEAAWYSTARLPS